MRIKLFEAVQIDKLEEQVNAFLEKIEPSREGAQSVVVDIKYQTPITTEYWAAGERTANEHMYSAMVIYK